MNDFSSSQMWFMWWLLSRNNGGGGAKQFCYDQYIYMRVRFVVGELMQLNLVVGVIIVILLYNS